MSEIPEDEFFDERDDTLVCGVCDSPYHTTAHCDVDKVDEYGGQIFTMAAHRNNSSESFAAKLNSLDWYWKITFTVAGFFALIMVLGIISNLTS